MNLAPTAQAADKARTTHKLGPWALIWMLAALFSTQPIATDLYLASLPSLKDYFGVSGASVQLTLTIYILSFGLGQLAVGPISDRYGRRPVMLAGCTMFVLGSIAAMLTPSFTGLLVARVLQALGSCCAAICARALVRDLYEPTQGAQTLSKAFTLMSLVPMIAPILGGFIQAQWGWRANFGLMSTLSLAILICAYFLLDESIPQKNPLATRAQDVVRNYIALIRSAELRAYGLGSAFSYCCLFCFISGSPFVVIKVLKVPTQYYGFCFASITFGFILGSMMLRRVLPSIGIKRSVFRGAMIGIVSTSVMLLLALAQVKTLWAVLLPMFGLMIGHGFVQPSCQAGAIGPFPEKAGAAAALVGFIIYSLAALVGMLVGYFVGDRYPDSTLPLAAITFACSLCGTFCNAVLVQRLPGR